MAALGLAGVKDLPSPPRVAMELMRLSDDPKAGIAEFAKVMANDPALTAKLLKLSNSSLLGMSGKITTLEQASVLLGMRTVQLLALSFTLIGGFAKTDLPRRFSYAEYWLRSLTSAVAAREIARLTNSKLADEGFLCGLLSNIGVLVMAQCIPQKYQRVIRRSAGWPLAEMEKQILGFDHFEVGGAVLADWGIPDAVHETVGHCANPEGLPADANEKTRALIWNARMAKLVEHVLCSPNRGEALQELHEIAQMQGLSRNQVDTLLLTIEARIKDLAESLELEELDIVSHYEILEEARSQMMHIGVNLAAQLKQQERRSDHLENENRRLLTRATTDTLTTLGNRAFFEALMDKELKTRITEHVPNCLGLLMIDIDKFKEINDEYGHQEGDEVLRILGQALKGLTRETDTPTRYGGEEFAVIAASTSPDGLRLFAERVRSAIAELKLPIKNRLHPLTVSIGGTCLSHVSSMEDGHRLIARADALLYQAKKNGRNRCEIDSERLT